MGTQKERAVVQANAIATEPSATTRDWSAIGRELAERFAATATEHDENDRFVADNYAYLKERGIFSAAIPADIGGGGASFAEICEIIREMAHGCGSTALAFSMHSHLLAATLWRLGQGHPVQPLLERIVNE